MAWPPIDERLKKMPVAVNVTEDEIRFRATDSALSYLLLRELVWFFAMPRDQKRLTTLLREARKPTAKEREEWLAWTNQNMKIHPELQRLSEENVAREKEFERIEGESAPTYIVRRDDNAAEWPAMHRHFKSFDGCDVLTPDIINRAFDVKNETLPPDERGRFFHSYIA